MVSNSIVLSNSSLVGSSAAGGTLTQWQGGRTVLVLAAQVYASGAVYLQMLAQNNSTLINVGGPYGANQITAYDLPLGQYKVINGASSSIGVLASLASVPY